MAKGNIATAYVQVIPSMDGVKSKLTEAFGGEGKKAGGLFGASLIKTAIGAISAAGIGKALTASLTEGAALQQSLDGVKVLFKESSDRVVASAKEAYKTTGLSANAYMEQVTSFSASLLQSLSGDTEQAATVSDMALRDMSDNANKFGTDMERITDAYQGFAKQNYTMLDNLKLGYGGTKTEMQRLLADAQKLTGVKYDIDNLSDVYNAIHAIQEEMGITGATAKEAVTTLTGSFNAMKAAAANVLGNLTMGQDVKPAMEALVETSVTFLRDNLAPAVGNIFTSIPVAAGTLLKELMPGSLQEAGDAAIEGFQNFATQKLPNILSVGSEIAGQFTMGLQTGTPKLLITAGDLLQKLLTTILSAAPSILSGGAQLILSLAKGLISSVPGIISAGASVLASLLSTIGSHLPDLLAQGADLIIELGVGLISAIPDIVSKAGELIGEVLDIFGETDWKTIGIDIVTGIIDGLWSIGSSLYEALRDLANDALQAAKDALGIASPSKKFRDAIGKFIPAGIAVGIQNHRGLVTKALQDLSGDATGDFTAALKMDYRTSGGQSVGKSVPQKIVSVIQHIHSQAKSAAELMQEARYEAEKAVLLGV